MLAYNSVDADDDIKPSKRMEEVYKSLCHTDINTKLQVSSGVDVLAACGQFIGN